MLSVLPGIFGMYASSMNHCYLGFHCWLLPKIFTQVGVKGTGELFHTDSLDHPRTPVSTAKRMPHALIR